MEKIIFIDDEIEITNELKSYFDKYYLVEIANSYDEAIVKLKQFHFDCVVSDVNLGEKQGYDIVKFVKNEMSEIPVILLSGLTEEEMILKGFDVGADDYVRKPFSLLELNARIGTRLKKNKKTKYIFGELEIDENSASVKFQQKPILITSMEFDILLLLVKNKGKAFNKEEIYNEIWKQEPLDQMHTVQVHMFTLRKKLIDATGIEFIKTIWKKGYIFDYEEETK